MDEEGKAFARRIFPATQILQGYSALPYDKLFTRMTRSEYVQYLQVCAVCWLLKHVHRGKAFS
jgi:hypothetical protein